ncbi:MAG: DUF3800 domain-containing protein [Candidatus Omnitrophica bacterium]|nr:DUF3800 domain-containing protein [Candidatus Omnitrophota bacterium]
MWFLYLDESGDLGFDFVNKKPSKYFTITVLAISDIIRNRMMLKAVDKVLKRKLNPRKQRKRIVLELKGTKTTIEIKKYFYNQLKDIKFGIYSITLNKKKLFSQLASNKDRVYNYVARLVLEKIPFEQAVGRINLVIDKSKSRQEIKEFNRYIISQLEGRIEPSVPLDIEHKTSNEHLGLQAVGLFSWGLFRKYEKKDSRWLDIFKEKVLLDILFLG